MQKQKKTNKILTTVLPLDGSIELAVERLSPTTVVKSNQEPSSAKADLHRVLCTQLQIRSKIICQDVDVHEVRALLTLRGE